MKLDLTKKRYEVLRKAREIVEEIDNISFVYADINCRLKVRFRDNSELFFEKKLIELYDLIEKECEQCFSFFTIHFLVFLTLWVLSLASD